MNPLKFVKAHEIRKDGPLALVVPMSMRRTLQLKKETRFVVRIEEGELVYTPIPQKSTLEPEQDEAD
jgi:hypothetical protein